MNPSASAVVERYAYDGFGKELTGSTPAVSSANTFRFSTKQMDIETGMNYYGYRFYVANAGRWINRDPIVEAGGDNVYGMIGNNSVLLYDVNGLSDDVVCVTGCSGGAIDEIRGGDSPSWTTGNEAEKQAAVDKWLVQNTGRHVKCTGNCDVGQTCSISVRDNEGALGSSLKIISDAGKSHYHLTPGKGKDGARKAMQVKISCSCK